MPPWQGVVRTHPRLSLALSFKDKAMHLAMLCSPQVKKAPRGLTPRAPGFPCTPSSVLKGQGVLAMAAWPTGQSQAQMLSFLPSTQPCPLLYPPSSSTAFPLHQRASCTRSHTHMAAWVTARHAPLTLLLRGLGVKTCSQDTLTPTSLSVLLP